MNQSPPLGYGGTARQSTYTQYSYHNPYQPHPAVASADPLLGYKQPAQALLALDERLLPSRKASKGFRVLGITLLMALGLILPATAWAYYMTYWETSTFDLRARTLYSTATASRLLLLSTALAGVSKLLVGPLMALHAYGAASDWLQGSKRIRHSRLPTPVQLGTLLSLYQGARYLDLIKACRAGMTRTSLKQPPLLTKAIAMLAWLLALVSSIAAVDIWLHIDASPSSSVPMSSNFASQGYNAGNSLFGRTVNQTMCGQGPTLSRIAESCGLSDFSATTQSYTISRTAQVLANNSDLSRVAWLNDNTAVLVPTTPPAVGYRAKALGVRSICRSITDQCVRCNSTARDVGITCVGPNAGVNLACTGSDRFNVSKGATGPYAPLASNGSEIYRDFNANPLTYGNVVSSSSYINTSRVSEAPDYFVGTTGFLIHGRSGGVNVLYCSVSVLDVVYEYQTPEQYSVVSTEMAEIAKANYVGYGLSAWSNTKQGFEGIDGMGLKGPATYPEIYARQLSKIAIASVTRIVPATASERLLAGHTAGTRITLVGLLLLFALSACLLLTVLGTGLHAMVLVSGTSSPFLAAGRGRLVSMLPLIGDSLGGLKHDFDTHQNAVSEASDSGAFLQETEQDRLVLAQEQVFRNGAPGSTVRLRPQRQ